MLNYQEREGNEQTKSFTQLLPHSCCFFVSLKKASVLVGTLDIIYMLMEMGNLITKSVVPSDLVAPSYRWFILPSFISLILRTLVFVRMWQKFDVIIYKNIYFFVRVITLIAQLILRVIAIELNNNFSNGQGPITEGVIFSLVSILDAYLTLIIFSYWMHSRPKKRIKPTLINPRANEFNNHKR